MTTLRAPAASRASRCGRPPAPAFVGSGPTRRRLVLAPVLGWLLASCATPVSPAVAPVADGAFTAMDAAFADTVVPGARIETIANGFTWAEGPTWLRADAALLFTDVPGNTLYRWTPAGGLSVLLQPSGLADADPAIVREAGANGLFADADGSVLLADSGSRVVARLDPRTGRKTVLATTYRGRRFDSPNDVVAHRSGAVYFTDPPYGLVGLHASPAREQDASGVYRIDPDGSVTLIDAGLRFPNGIALSPDQRTLYVSNSDPAHPVWMAYALDAVGGVAGSRVFADASDLMGDGVPGLPDGMAVADDGRIFATAPGGVLVMDAGGRRLGRIATGAAVSNCAFGDDGRTLYMTSHTRVARVRVNAVGIGFRDRGPALPTPSDPTRQSPTTR